MKRRTVISALLIMAMILSLFSPVGVYAEELYTTISVENVKAKPGDTVDVKVSIANNTGIIGAGLQVSYDEGLELIDAKSGTGFEGLSMTKPGNYASPCKFIWDSVDISSDSVSDGEILILTFKVSDTVQSGTDLNVQVSYNDGDFINTALEPVEVQLVNGVVSIQSYVPGDVSGDGQVSTADVILIRRYLAGGYDVSFNLDAADVNGDSKINTLDVILIRRVLAGGYTDENGEPLVLIPGNMLCVHNLKAFEEKAATCTEDGNIPYWFCDKCKKYFRDANGVNVVSEQNIVIKAKGHTPVVDPAVEATSTTPGLTEGSHCSTCGLTLVEQQTIDIPSNSFELKYNISNGDTYLAKQEIDNPNPLSIKEGANLWLKDIEVDGYTFLGWFDGAGDNATQIKKIENADHSMTIYAHWKKLEYTIQFKSDLVPVDSITYTTKEGKILPSPSLDGYTFVGWTDFDGNIYTQIKSGTKGDITLYANWISDRNKAWAKKKLDEPMVYDDGNVILFAYEIGEIRDVPIYEIENFGKINQDGVSQTVTKKYSVSVSEQLMKSYTKTIENSTTKSDTWTLSNGWTDSVEMSEEWCNQQNITKEEAETQGKSDTGNWYVSNSSGGSNSTAVIDSTDTYSLTTKTNNTHSWSKDYAEKESHGTDVKKHQTANLEVSGGYGNGSAPGGHFDITGSYENGRETNKEGDDTTTMKGKVYDKTSNTQSGSISNHTSNSTTTSTWNSESGYGGSSTTSSSKTVSSAISEMLSGKTGYGSSYIKNSGETNTQGQVDYTSNNDSYSSSVTYSKITSEEVEMTYTTTNTKTGYHRWVMAGTAHVFGIVGYDIASKSYFVYTYSIMDDEMHRFEDYSYNTSSYDDNQNGVIPFDIPVEIENYVSERVFETEGLEIDENGVITDYTGSDSFVVIPDYKVTDNKDGSVSVIKVVGLDENAFKGNENITGVKLSRFIKELPRNAFKGCTKLWQIDACVISVGDNAFKDCPLLSEWDISSSVIKLGSNVFEGAEKITVKAANTSVVNSALNSGAKDITIGLDKLSDSLNDSTLNVLSETDSVAFFAYGKSFNNLIINSEANRTTINRLNIESDGVMPLNIKSSNVEFYQSSIKNTGICAAFSANNLTLDLYGASSMDSEGPNVLFCKDTDAIRTTSGLKTSLTLTGNLVTCGEINDPNKYIIFKEGTNGKILKVDVETFESMLKAYKITFNANGGECDLLSKQVDNGVAIGELPIPAKIGYDFEGWYLEDNTKVTSSSVFSTGKDITVIAKWKVKEYTVKWDSEANYTVNVYRSASPYKNASVGNLSNNDSVYYGDTLYVSYQAKSGYKINKTGKTKIVVDKNITSEDIYATVGKLSDGWVLASEIPEGAEILEEKWSYDKITNIISDVEEVEGYTLYDTTFVWSDWGDWSSWSNTKPNPGAGDSRQVETRNIAATYKTQYQYERCYGKGSSGYYLSYPWQSGVCQTWEWTNWLDNPLPCEGLDSSINSAAYYYGRGYNTDGVYVTGKNGSRWDIPWWSQNTRQVQVTPAYTQYRYRDRDKIYTYYLTKSEQKESNTEISESDDIKNVQKWVKYVVY